MLRRALSILLTAMIVACPCICKGGCAARSSDRAEVHCHCDCCHAEIPALLDHEVSSPSDEHSPPTPDHPSRSHDCGHQCICKGAVVEDAGQFDIGLDVSSWVAAELPQFSYIAALVSRGNSLWVSPPPDGGANPGRTLCCRYGFFLI